MRKILLLNVLVLLFTCAFAQLPERTSMGETSFSDIFEMQDVNANRGVEWIKYSKNFTGTDIKGNPVNLQADLDAGKMIILDISAAWCNPCWQFHKAGILDGIYKKYGPAGTNEVAVYFFEAESSNTINQLKGDSTANTYAEKSCGDFTKLNGEDVPYTIVDDYTIMESFPIEGFPSFFGVIPMGFYVDLKDHISGQSLDEMITNWYNLLKENVEEKAPSFTIQGPSFAYSNSPITFKVNLNNPPADGFTYAWSFPSGTPATSTVANPSVTWTQEGSYDVSLTVTNPKGEKTETKNVKIEAQKEFYTEFKFDFEDFDDFSTSLLPFTTHDGDGKNTFAFGSASYPGMGAPSSFIAFVPTKMTPPVNIPGHSGIKMAASFGAEAGSTNDWLISPKIKVQDNVFSFWASSSSPEYLESIEVKISTTDNKPASFTAALSGNSPIIVPVGWTEFVYDLKDYAGKEVFVAIRNVSNDKFFLLIDDVELKVKTSISEDSFAHTSIYPNPANDVFNILNAEGVDIIITNSIGQVVAEVKSASNNQQIDASSFDSGTYFIRLVKENDFSYRKIVIVK